MPPNVNQTERQISLVITIVIDSMPASSAQDIKEQAYKLGDEFGARVNISEAQARVSPLQG